MVDWCQIFSMERCVFTANRWESLSVPHFFRPLTDRPTVQLLKSRQ